MDESDLNDLPTASERFLTSEELGLVWGITAREVRRLAAMGRITGADKLANRWLFHLYTIRPDDGRKVFKKPLDSLPPLFWLPAGRQ